MLSSVWQTDGAVDRLSLGREAPCPAFDGASSSRCSAARRRGRWWGERSRATGSDASAYFTKYNALTSYSTLTRAGRSDSKEASNDSRLRGPRRPARRPTGRVPKSLYPAFRDRDEFTVKCRQGNARRFWKSLDSCGVMWTGKAVVSKTTSMISMGRARVPLSTIELSPNISY